MHVTGIGPRRTARLAALIAVGVAAAVPMGTAGAAEIERRYELVSPPQKGAAGVFIGHRASDDGNAVAYMTPSPLADDDGGFGKLTFVSRRTPSGWVTRSAMPIARAEHRGLTSVNTTAVDFSDDFRHAYLLTNDPMDRDDVGPGELGPAANLHQLGWDLYRFGIDTRVSGWLSRPTPDRFDAERGGATDAFYIGRSDDGRHVLFLSYAQLTSETTTGSTLYESVDGAVRHVGFLPDGTPASDVRAATRHWWTGDVASHRASQSISSDGSRIYWLAVNSLYLREDGVRTLPVSVSERTGDAGTVGPGTFLGATRDGATAYFYSDAELTDDAVTGGNLYRWDREKPEGQRLTRLPLPGPVEVSAINLRILSEDGSRLYFESSSRLHPSAGAAGNLYVWDGSELRFVASIGHAPGLTRVRVSRDGRFAAFASSNDIAGARLNGRVGIYRYDAVTGEIACASCVDDDGSLGDAEFQPQFARYGVGLIPGSHVNPRNITDDGRVIFQTTAALVPHDTNDNFDVYEFDGEQTHLISSGTGDGSELVDNTPDGNSIFFVTSESLVPHDTDGGYPDVYVARAGGGFSAPPAWAPCAGDDCQGSPSIAPTFQIPGSELIAPEEAASRAPSRTATVRVLKPTKLTLRRAAKSGRIALRVRVSAAGTIRAVGRSRIGARNRIVARTTRAVARGRTLRVPLRLTAVARRQLARRGVLTVRTVVRFSAARGTASAVLRLTTARR